MSALRILRAPQAGVSFVPFCVYGITLSRKRGIIMGEKQPSASGPLQASLPFIYFSHGIYTENML